MNDDPTATPDPEAAPAPAPYEAPDVRRARQREEIRALRGSPERAAEIAAIEERKAQAKKRPSSASSVKKTPENSTEIFGHPWEQWFAMRDAATAHLEARAAEGRLTTTAEVWAAVGEGVGADVGKPGLQLPKLLATVAADAFPARQAVLTALVATPDGDGPDPSFFRHAADAGVLPAEASPAPTKGAAPTEAQLAHWQSTVAALHGTAAG